MGVNRAKWFMMTGERVSGELLFEMGLVNFLVEDNEIFDKALACADQLAAGPAQAISASKVPINHYIRILGQARLREPGPARRTPSKAGPAGAAASPDRSSGSEICV